MMAEILWTVVINGVFAFNTYISYHELEDAIAEVESNSGRTSGNIYQLTEIYVQDVCAISGQQLDYASASRHDPISRWCMETYWGFYGRKYAEKTNYPINAEALARIHNGGPNGYAKPETKKYWAKVDRVLKLNRGYAK